jgi:hypothetical protein
MIALAPRARRRPALLATLAPRAEGEHSARAWRKGRACGGRAGWKSFDFNAVTHETQCNAQVFQVFGNDFSGLARMKRLKRFSRAHVMSCGAGGALGAFSYARACRFNRFKHKKGDKFLYLSMKHLKRLAVSGRFRQVNKNWGIPA